MGRLQAASDGARVSDRRRLVTAILLVVVAVSNSAFLIAPLVGARLSLNQSFVSELGANGEPGAIVFRLSDFVTGSLLIISSLLLWRVFPRTKLARIAQICLLCVAVLTLADAFLPLDCVSSADQLCRALETKRLLSLSHQTHFYTGIIEWTLINIALGFFAWSLRNKLGWQTLSKIAFPLAGFYLVGNMVIIVQYLREVPHLGITQRCQILAFSAFLLLLAVEQYSASRIDRRPQSGAAVIDISQRPQRRSAVKNEQQARDQRIG